MNTKRRPLDSASALAPIQLFYCIFYFSPHCLCVSRSASAAPFCIRAFPASLTFAIRRLVLDPEDVVSASSLCAHAPPSNFPPKLSYMPLPLIAMVSTMTSPRMGSLAAQMAEGDFTRTSIIHSSQRPPL